MSYNKVLESGFKQKCRQEINGLWQVWPMEFLSEDFEIRTASHYGPIGISFVHSYLDYCSIHFNDENPIYAEV